MKLRSFLYILTGVVLALLLMGASGFFWLTAQSPLKLLQGGAQSSPAAAIFVPKQTPAMVSLLVNPDRLEAFRLAIVSPGQRRRSQAELNQLKQSLLSGTGLDYSRDVQPWVGDEVTLAVTAPDIDRNQTNGQQPGYLLAVATRDPEQSRQFLQSFWQKRAVTGTDLVFEQYAGVKLIYGSTANTEGHKDNPLTARSPTLASAVVGDRFVLFANHPKVLREAITNVQAPDLNLESVVAYQQALESLPSRQIGLTYVNLPRLSEWLGKETRPDLNQEEPLYDSLVAALELDRQGIVAETALIAASGQTLPRTRPELSKPVGALKFIPASSSVSASGTDLQQLWARLDTTVEGYEGISSLLDQAVADFRDRSSLDLTEDVFSWVQGEYALASLPRPNQVQSDWIFVAETSSAAKSAVDKLDAIAKQQGFSVGPIDLDNQQILAWTKLSTATQATSKTSSPAAFTSLTAEVQGVRASLDNYEILTTSIEAMDQALKASQTSLLSGDSFKRAIAPIDTPNNGYLYLDWSTSQDWVRQRLPIVRLVELAGKPIFDHLRSLTVSSYGSDTQISRGAVFIRLAD